jgi:hypothetical protein
MSCVNGRLVPACPEAGSYGCGCNSNGNCDYPVGDLYYYDLGNGACSQDCPVRGGPDPGTYDQSCSQDTDCATVSLICGCCPEAVMNAGP